MKLVNPSEIKGAVIAPPSKSMTVRAIAAALLAEGDVHIDRPSSCDDAVSALGIVERMGSSVTRESESLLVAGKLRTTGQLMPTVLECGESGLCMRMFAPIAALTGDRTVLVASGSLKTRPMRTVEQLSGLDVRCTTDDGFAPIAVEGPLRGGTLHVDGAETSQFLTGLLMALPRCTDHSTIIVSNLASRPYVRMTMALLRRFGIEIEYDEKAETFFIRGNQVYTPTTYRVEGDWSGASFLLVAGAIAGKVTVEGLDSDSFQADKAIIHALEEAGTRMSVDKDRTHVETDRLRSFTFDATDAPDLFPPLVALASVCEGTSVIHGVQRLTHKESNRAVALATEFAKLGITIEISGGKMSIRGGRLQGNTVDSHRDHRIAMACAVAALRAKGPTTIMDSTCVTKSYPDFFSDLSLLQVTP